MSSKANRCKELAHEENDHEYISLIEADNKSLSTELERVRSSLEKVEIVLEIERGEREAEEENAAANLKHWRERCHQAEEKAKRNRDSSSALDNCSSLPESVLDVVELIAKAFPDRIKFTDRAYASAKDASLDNPNIAWKILWSMARTGFELSLTEGKTTKSDKNLIKIRKDSFKGEEINLMAHVKHGNKKPKLLRVHYYPYKGEKGNYIVVGHCGDHLDTAGTRRKK